MVFAEKLTRLLQLRGLSARALASELEFSNATVSAWLKGAGPRPDALKTLAEFLQIPIEVLADDAKGLPFDQHLAELGDTSKAALAEFPDNPPAARVLSDFLDLKNANRRQAAAVLQSIKDLAIAGRELDGDEPRFDILLAAIRGDVARVITPEMHEAARRRALADGAARRPAPSEPGKRREA